MGGTSGDTSWGLDTRSRRSAAGSTSPNSCESEVSDVPWRQLIEEASINVLRRYRRGAEVLDLSEWTPPKKSPGGYRLTPLLAEGLPNMIFGDGGVGKSMVALWLSTMVTEGMQEPFECNPGNVLYLDWEMEAEETQGRLGRIAEGMGLPTPPRVFYRRCAGRLVDDVEWLAETVQSKGIDLVVVDSAVPACGGNPNEPESVQSLFYGLRQLEVTSLIVAHVSKSVAAGPVRRVRYGSVFWSNLSRNVWQAQKEQEMGEDSMVVALWHRKTNVGPLLKPVTLKIDVLSVVLGGEGVTGGVPDAGGETAAGGADGGSTRKWRDEQFRTGGSYRRENRFGSSHAKQAGRPVLASWMATGGV